MKSPVGPQTKPLTFTLGGFGLIIKKTALMEPGFPKSEYVRGGDEKPFGAKEEKGKPPDLKEYTEEAQKFLDSYRRFLMTFAKDISLRFQFADKFFINLETGEVNMAAQWFHERGYSREQILWACLHELSHFRDLADDPEGMKENFEHIEKKARSTGAVMMEKWEDKFGASDPDFIDQIKKPRPVSKKDKSKKMNAVEQAAFQIHHGFWNMLDDIHVNNQVRRRASRFATEKPDGTLLHGEEVQELYRGKLFPKTDYTEIPRHLQFMYKLLREEMVPEEEVQVTGEVEKALERKIRFKGEEYTPQEIVERFVKPGSSRDTRAGVRYPVIQKTLEPIFEELLRKDLAEWDPEKPPPASGGDEGKPEPGGAGEMNPFAGDYKDYADQSPDQMDEEEVENWADKHEEEEKEKERQAREREKEDGKTAAEKAREAQERLDREWCKEHHVSPDTLARFRQVEAEVAPYLEELSRLWQNIVFGSARATETGIEGHFRDGVNLDIQKAIDEWPRIAGGDMEEARVMERITSKEVLVRRPELIRVRLVGDVSSSMNSPREKQHVLEQCFVLLLSSLREFNTYLSLTRSQTRSKLMVDTEAWTFGDKASKVKPLRSEAGEEDEQETIVKVFQKLKATEGSTYDDRALKAIKSELSPQDMQGMQDKKILDIVFEITDGGSTNAPEARKQLDGLLSSGVVARAFQIGNVNDTEKRIFEEVWNKDRGEKLGELVGGNVANLLPAVTTALKRYLRNVAL